MNFLVLHSIKCNLLLAKMTISSSLIIASDQALKCNNKILGKPGDNKNAKEQLNFMSGKIASFYTGLYVINKKTNLISKDVIRFDVEFRMLSSIEIDKPLLKACSKPKSFNLSKNSTVS